MASTTLRVTVTLNSIEHKLVFDVLSGYEGVDRVRTARMLMAVGLTHLTQQGPNPTAAHHDVTLRPFPAGVTPLMAEVPALQPSSQFSLTSVPGIPDRFVRWFRRSRNRSASDTT